MWQWGLLVTVLASYGDQECPIYRGCIRRCLTECQNFKVPDWRPRYIDITPFYSGFGKTILFCWNTKFIRHFNFVVNFSKKKIELIVETTKNFNIVEACLNSFPLSTLPCPLSCRADCTKQSALKRDIKDLPPTKYYGKGFSHNSCLMLI